MKRTIPPIFWGIILITILFIAVVILISSFNWIQGFLFRRPVPEATPTAIPEITVTPAVTSTPITLPWDNRITVLYFPVLPVNIHQYTLLQIKNTGANRADDIQVALLNRAGEYRTYLVDSLEPGAISRFSLKDLLELPINFSPGLAIVSSNGSIATVAETFPAGSDEKNPVESLTPLAALPSDLNFKIYPTTDSEPAQNRLSITNPETKLIEVQVRLTTPEQGSQIILTKELPPLTTEIIELPIPKFQSFDQTATVSASSTDRIIGAIYRLDNDGGLLSNIETE